MVCAKKSAASLAAAATSVYQSYSPSATGTGASASGGASATGLNGTNVLAASTATANATVSAANSGIKGFNYGAFFLDYSAKVESDFEYEFQRAQDLTGTSGWSSARLYTMGEYLPPYLPSQVLYIVPRGPLGTGMSALLVGAKI